KDLRAKSSLPVLDELKPWMLAQRQAMTKGTAGAKALEYSLRRWEALTRYAHSGHLPIDNNPIERLIRPWALGRNKANPAFMRSRHGAVGRRTGQGRIKTPIPLHIITVTALARKPARPLALDTALA
ncbi:MAG: transposase, partial [Hydrogenophaga sp.]|nr:transposase [Hydrogenophaga sp.]